MIAGDFTSPNDIAINTLNDPFKHFNSLASFTSQFSTPEFTSTCSFHFNSIFLDVLRCAEIPCHQQGHDFCLLILLEVI